MFQDKWSRWHHKPIKEGQLYSSNNPWIYTAECTVAGLDSDIIDLYDCYMASETKYGFQRSPGQELPAVSHDEVIGLIFLASIISSDFANDLIDKWESQGWQICNLEGFEPKKWYQINWFGVVIDFYKIWRMGVLYKKTGGKEGMQNRHATILFPRVHPIAFKMGGWKRYLIKRHAGRDTTLAEKLSFLVSKLWTIYSSKELNSGKRILGFQLKMIENNQTFVERIIYKAFFSRYNLKEVAAQEYVTGHPILEKL